MLEGANTVMENLCLESDLNNNVVLPNLDARRRSLRNKDCVL